VIQPPPFAQFIGSLTRLGGGAVADPAMRTTFRNRATALLALDRTPEAIAEALRKDPELVPMLGLVVGLSQEVLKNTLRVKLGTAGWVRLARENPRTIVDMLEGEFQLLDRLSEEAVQEWEYGDILLERAGARGRAGRAIGRGRALEDEVERIVGPAGLDLPYQLRTRFVGSAGRSAPCDIAIPGGDEQAMIAVGIKGFNSTGSKLTDAAREVESMAEVRLPRQFIFAVVDGIGWLGRKSDLKRIYELWVNHRIDGVYTLTQLAEFRKDLAIAARRLGLTATQ
jgi:hypothetical protein